jgi:hypothetical protein
MATWECSECGAAYAVGAPACPQCGATDHAEEGVAMPKISKVGGPSIEPAVATATAESGEPGLAERADLGFTQATEVQEAGEQTAAEAEAGEDEQFNPADYTVAEVNTYLDQCQEDGNEQEYNRVMTAEKTGRGRLSIVNRG